MLEGKHPELGAGSLRFRYYVCHDIYLGKANKHLHFIKPYRIIVKYSHNNRHIIIERLWMRLMNLLFPQMSLMMTIINLAQNFVGSNNLNLLQPIGQFGTRLHGGKDSASPRYIFTMLRWVWFQFLVNYHFQFWSIVRINWPKTEKFS